MSSNNSIIENLLVVKGLIELILWQNTIIEQLQIESNSFESVAERLADQVEQLQEHEVMLVKGRNVALNRIEQLKAYGT